MPKTKSPEMGKFCKAYLAKHFRQFPGWSENLQNLREEITVDEEGVEHVFIRPEIKDDDVLYLQEDYIVTDDIFKDRYIVFDQVDEQWKTFCKETLRFKLPAFMRPEDAIFKPKKWENKL